MRKNGGKKYNAMIESLDNAVGKVIDALDATQTRDKTLLIFYSDNGGHFPTPWLADKKGSLLEGGLRVPMVVSWPDVIEARTTCDQPVTSMDFFPTFVHAAGGSTAEFTLLEGLDLKPLFQRSSKLDRDALYWHFPHNRKVSHSMGSTILDGDWKYYQGYGLVEDALYNLEDDPLEKSNVIDTNPELANKLSTKLNAWLTRVSATMPKTNSAK